MPRPEEPLLVHALGKPRAGKPVQREDVHPHVLDVLVGGGMVHDLHLLGADAGKGAAVPGVVVDGREVHALGQLGFHRVDELHVDRARHAHVDVVVPGDEAVVADRAQQRPANHEALVAVVLADALKHIEQLELDALQALELLIRLKCVGQGGPVLPGCVAY